MSDSRRIKVPARFFDQSFTLVLRMISFRVVCLIGCLSIVTLIWSNLPLDFWLKFLLSLPFSIFGGASFQNLALVGHDGGHFSLHHNRMTSARIGTIVSSLVPMHFDTGFLLSHASHHRFTNSEKDPDLKLFKPYRSVVGRIFTARLRASRHYLITTLKLAFERVPAKELEACSLSKSELKYLARLNILVSGTFLTVYALLIYNVGKSFAFAFGSSYLFAVILSSIRPYLEHIGTGTGRYNNSRTWSGTFMELFFGGINYHHAHHLYPIVPAYKIRGLHQWLVRNGYIVPEVAVQTKGWTELVKIVLSDKDYGSN